MDPIFGFEFTFTQPDLLNTADPRLTEPKRNQIEGVAARRAGFARVDGSQSLIPVTANKTVKFQTDIKVVEVTGTPDTYDGYVRDAKLYDHLIFGAAAEVDMFPHEFTGGGHVHIGRVFDSNPQLLRDFYVDMVNHPSLFVGIFSYNTRGAQSLADRPFVAQSAYVDVIRSLDAQIANLTSEETARILYTIQNDDRNFAVNLKNFATGRLSTVELRISPEKSFADFLLIIKFFRARLWYLANHPRQPIRINPGPRNFLEAQAEFRKLVTESGLEWSDYAHFGIATGRRAPENNYRKQLFEAMDERGVIAARANNPEVPRTLFSMLAESMGVAEPAHAVCDHLLGQAPAAAH